MPILADYLVILTEGKDPFPSVARILRRLL